MPNALVVGAFAVGTQAASPASRLPVHFQLSPAPIYPTSPPSYSSAEDRLGTDPHASQARQAARKRQEVGATVMMLTGITTTVSLSIMRATEDLHGVWVDPVVAGSGIIGGTGFLLLIDPKALGGHRGL